MKRKFLFGVIAAIALMAFASAAIYVEPWNTDVDAGGHDIDNVNNITANNFLGNVSGNMDWSNLQNYPSACPGSSAVTTLGDSATCSDLWVDVAGDTMTGALHISNVLNITGNFTINNSVFFVNRDNGRVGIGMTGPSEKLDVAGAIKVSGTIYGNRADRFAFYAISGGVYAGGLVDNYFAGNVGIGTDSPTHKLNVVGDGNFTGNLTLGDKITFAFGQFIDNLVDGWLRITGNLQVDGDTNMTGNLNVSANLVVGGNITGNQFYGDMWMQNESGYVTTAIASSDVWYNLTGFNNTDVVTGQTLHGFTYDNVAEHLTVLVAGKYRAIYSVSKGNAGNNQEYQFAVAINSIIQNNTVIHRKLGTGGDVGDTATSGFLDLVVNDNIHLMTLNKDGTADIQAHAMNLNLVRIGD